jgi:general secretion pathway protein K
MSVKLPPLFRRRQALQAKRGVVLLMVLWIIILLTVLVSSYVQSASTEGQQARYMLNTTEARYAAEAGLHRAIFELNNPTLEMRWKGDGRPYEMAFDDAQITVELIDETGKIDLNNADPKLLEAMFAQAGVDQLSAQKLAGAVIDWRDPDELLTPNGAEKDEYRRADLDYGPRNQYFVTVSELQQVLGMDFDLFQKLEPMLTINAGGATPNLAFAQSDVMAAVFAQQGQTMSQEQLEAIIQMRRTLPVGQPIVLPNGMSILPGGPGVTYTIKSRAELASGAKASLEATVQLGSGTVGGRPFRISRWREGQSN